MRRDKAQRCIYPGAMTNLEANRSVCKQVAREFRPQKIILFGTREWTHKAEGDFEIMEALADQPDTINILRPALMRRAFSGRP